MACLRSSFPVFHRFAVFLALLAMLAPLGVGFVHHPRAAPMQMPMGMSMSMPMPGMAPSADSNHAKKTPPCPICQSLHMLAVGFVTPNAVFFAAPVFPPLAFSVSRQAFPLQLVRITQAQPRAPPIPV